MPPGRNHRGTSLMPRIMLLIAVVLATSGMAVAAETLGQQLYALDQMRAGDETPFEQVEQKARKLLTEFPAPEDQALIYFTVEGVYAQTGQLWPEKTAFFAAKAIEAGLDPVRRMQAYVYWGDSIQALHRGVQGAALAEARRKVVVPYLLGLRVAVEEGVPDEAPPLPVPRAHLTGGKDAGFSDEEILRARQHAADWERAQHVRNVIRYRDILTSQISSVYSKQPFATDEVEAMAREILKEDHAVARLMATVKEPRTE